MRFDPESPFATALLGAMTAMAALATDMYLPALPAIALELGAGVPRTQLTLSLFLVAYATGQLVYGPVGDAFGRRPGLAVAFALFALGSAGCMLAPTIEALVAARLVQALGAAGPIVLARAVVRDLHEGPRAARELSRMGAIMGVAPAVAPLAGALVLQAAGWRAIFGLILLVAAGFGLLVWRVLPETLAPANRRPASPRAMAGSYRLLLADLGYRAYVALGALAYGGLFTFISVSSFILQGMYGLSPLAFGATFGLCSLAFITGSALASRRVMRAGTEGAIGLGVALLAAGGVGQLALVGLMPGAVAALIGPMLVFLVGIGLVLPPAMAAAVQPFPERAGTASALLSFAQLLFGSLVGLGVAASLGATPLPLPLATAASGLCALAVFWATRAARTAR